MSQYKLTLLHNSHNFLNEALMKAISAEKKIDDWKFAILFLVQSIELSLKEKLSREHSILIYKNIDNREQTVTTSQCINRLKNICNVELNNEDIEAIAQASKIRNAIVHSEFELSTDIVKLVFAKLLRFLESFHRNHLQENILEIIDESTKYEAISIDAYARGLHSNALVRFEEEGIDEEYIWFCPACGWGTFVVQDDINICFLCSHQDNTVMCDSCKRMFFEFETEQNEHYINGWDTYENKTLCKECSNKYLNELNDQDYFNDNY